MTLFHFSSAAKLQVLTEAKGSEESTVMQGISLLFLKNHFGDISCLTVFGIVILAHSELHRSGSSFMSHKCHHKDGLI